MIEHLERYGVQDHHHHHHHNHHHITTISITLLSAPSLPLAYYYQYNHYYQRNITISAPSLPYARSLLSTIITIIRHYH